MATTVVGPINASPGLLGGVFAGYNITAAGVVYTGPATVCTLTCLVGGSIVLNDCASVGAAAITNQIISVAMAAGKVIALNWPCATGITASAVTSGTFSLTFS